MPLPIICAYDSFQQYLISYRDLFSKPQYKYFVIVLENRLVLSQDCNAAWPKEAVSAASVVSSREPPGIAQRWWPGGKSAFARR